MSFLRWMRAPLVAGVLATILLPTHGLAIVGGHDSTLADWPSMVALVEEKPGYPYSHHFCGGVLIAPQWALTAASCLDQYTYGGDSLDSLRVVVGETDLTAYFRPGASGVFRASKVFAPQDSGHILAQGHTKNSPGNVALIKLDRPVTSPPVKLKPGLFIATTDEVSLATSQWQQATALGWGQNTEEQTLSYRYLHDPSSITASGNPKLQQVSLPLVDPKKCMKQLNWVYAPDKVICAGRDEGGAGICHDDTGGPLFIDVHGRKKLAGIIDFGVGCARPRRPSIYSSVPNAMPWIMSVVTKN